VIKVYRKGSKNPQTKKISRFPCFIGRSIENDLIVDCEGVSGRHAVIIKTFLGYKIKDLGSKNGLWINNKSKEEVVLLHGIEVYLGHNKVEFLLEREGFDETKEIHYRHYLFNKNYKQKVFNELFLIAILCLINHYLMADHGILEYGFRLFVVFTLSLGMSGLIAWLSKLMLKASHFIEFFSISNRAVIFLLFFNAIGDSFLFLFSEKWIINTVEDIVLFGFLWWFGYRVCRVLLQKMSQLKLRLLVTGCALFLMVAGAVFAYFGNGYEYNGTVGYPLLQSGYKNSESILESIEKSALRVKTMRDDSEQEVKTTQENTK